MLAHGRQDPHWGHLLQDQLHPVALLLLLLLLRCAGRAAVGTGGQGLRRWVVVAFCQQPPQ